MNAATKEWLHSAAREARLSVSDKQGAEAGSGQDGPYLGEILS